MKCRRAFEADLPAMLRGDGDAEFRAHYPGCADCAGEVLVWQELDALLRAGAPAVAGHPEPDELLAFVDAPATLATPARAAVERHLIECCVCADEVASLRRADLGALVADIGGAAPSRGVSRPSPPRASPGWLPRLVWHPAFAYALVAVLLVPVLRDQVARFSARERALPAMAPQVPAPGAEVEGSSHPFGEALARPEIAAARRRQAAGPDARRDLDRMVPRKAAPAEARPEQVAPGAGAPAVAERRAEPAPLEPDGAPALRDLAGTAAADRAQPAAPSGAPVLALSGDRHGTIALADAERGPLLRIAMPPGAEGTPLDVRLRSQGGREIVERVRVRANAIEVQIPPQFLTLGDYVVALEAPSDTRASGGAARDERATMLGFTVRAPTAAEAGANAR